MRPPRQRHGVFEGGCAHNRITPSPLSRTSNTGWRWVVPIRVEMHEARVLGQMVVAERASRSQRRRWDSRQALVRQEVPRLLGQAWRRRTRSFSIWRSISWFLPWASWPCERRRRCTLRSGGAARWPSSGTLRGAPRPSVCFYAPGHGPCRGLGRRACSLCSRRRFT